MVSIILGMGEFEIFTVLLQSFSFLFSAYKKNILPLHLEEYYVMVWVLSPRCYCSDVCDRQVLAAEATSHELLE